MKTPPKKPRGRPHIPAKSRKKPAVAFKLTDSQKERFHAHAVAEQLTLTDYFVGRCCQ